jgi:hypothetical protein
MLHGLKDYTKSVVSISGESVVVMTLHLPQSTIQVWSQNTLEHPFVESIIMLYIL